MKNVPFNTPEETLEALRLAADAADLGIWDLNARTQELHWSDRCRAIFGVDTNTPLTLESFVQLLHPEERERVDAAMNAAFDPAGSREYDIEYRICRPTREVRYVHAKGKALFQEGDGTLELVRFVGTILDRTEQRLSQSALLQAEQLAVIGRLAASVAHEINNPLEAVTNLLYLLREEIQSPSGTAYLQQAEAELARVSDITTNTLRFYRDPKGETAVQIDGLLRSVLALFQGKMVVHGVECELSCAADLHVSTKQGELRQVLVNLIGNAIDAMPRGGRLRIRARSATCAADQALPGVCLTVADTGTGMSPEVLRQVFDAFYTTKGEAGTGLGLWLSREIIRKRGYSLHVKSRLGHGTAFSLFLPKEPPPSGKVPA